MEKVFFEEVGGPAGFFIRSVGEVLTGNGSDTLSWKRLADYCAKNSVDAVFLTEADEWDDAVWKWLLQGDRAFFGLPVIGWYSWTQSFYPGERIDSTQPDRRSLRTRLKHWVLNWVDRARLDPKGAMLERLARGEGPFTTILVRDERVAEARGHPFKWMPCLYRVPRELANGRPRTDLLARVGRFLEAHRGASVQVYFGRAKAHRGFDLMVRFAARQPEVVLVHCGESSPLGLDEESYAGARDQLRREDRILELDEYVTDPAVIDRCWSATTHAVMTHRINVSSGNFLDALDRGIPVLAPNGGLMGSRVINRGLGQTYRSGDETDLCAQWAKFRQVDPKRFGDSIQAFMRPFSDAEQAARIIGILRGGTNEAT